MYCEWIDLIEEEEMDKPIPINVLAKERMSLNLFATVGTKAFRRISLQEASHDAPCLCWHVCREYEGLSQDSLVHRVDVLVVERGQAGLLKYVLERES